MRVLLIDPNETRSDGLQAALKQDGCEVIARRDLSESPESVVAKTRPDIILIEQDSPTRDTLESMRRISETNPHPVALFLDRSDKESMKKAIRAGVSAYVVNEADLSRARSILDVAMARFESHQQALETQRQLAEELDRSSTQLRERKLVERAKGILMKTMGLDENEAFEALRSAAMERNIRLAELAERVVSNHLGRA